jgi:phasin family protein
MFPLPEQISSAAKSQLENQLQIFSTLTSKVFESAEKIIALNLSAGKAALSHTAETAQHLLETQDPRDFFSYSTSQAQPNIESVLAYSRQLFGIASSTQAELLASAKARLDATTPAAPAASKPALAVVAPAPAPAPAAAPAPVAAKPAEVTKPAEVAKPAAKAAPAPVAAPAVKPAPAPAPAKAADKPAVKAAETKPAAKPEVAKPAPAPAAAPAKAAAPAPAKPFPSSKPAAKPASAAGKTVAQAAVKPAAKPAAKGTPSKQLDMLGGGKGSGRK